MSNTNIWDKLEKTDPSHTKPFTRAGGFKGKSVKPIYTDLKMTELFGPCGIGWGITEPQYQLVNAPDGQVIVYCWLSIWFEKDGKRSSPIPGVGGDFVVNKFSRGLVPDDEAFKKAATDAIGNAMKHIGMSADVYMGQHDDDKYVTALRNEIAQEAYEPDAETTALKKQIESAKTAEGLTEMGQSLKQRIGKLSDGHKEYIRGIYKAKLATLTANEQPNTMEAA